MPPDAIIAALKQGNALELEFVKKLKEGLDVIADGMQTECYKRGDALDELRKMVEGVDLDRGHATSSRSRAVILRGGRAELTPARKVKVTNLIKDGIRDCHEAKYAARKEHLDAREKALEMHETDRNAVQEKFDKLSERADCLDGMKALMGDLRTNRATRDVYHKLWEKLVASTETIIAEMEAIPREMEAIIERHGDRLQQIETGYRKATEAELRSVEAFEKFAKALDLDICI